MDRLSIVLTLMTAAVISYAVGVVLLMFGYYTWWAFAGSWTVGFILCWPAAYWISRKIKANDPFWNEKRKDEVDGWVPDPDHREV
ncbi:hypothetical protein [Histidinibacterium lentulum]|uniref:DUF2842 domain-containing protein n=1 Tax=Histidinibacterium lentulum TaxID=2480588 RepID=A0A3N2R8D3_9RHOB|nr:hypothetical protein [Histidinibacterium lentulum]ROU03586.1 hypothetical protein EAT49_04630 [Histidinibacterium lentulum]